MRLIRDNRRRKYASLRASISRKHCIFRHTNLTIPMSLSRSSLLCLVAVVAASFRFADDEFVNRLIASLNAYRLHLPTEKVYLQTDRDTYLPGETVWLSGSLFDGATHLADSVSAVLYVELIDTQSRRRTLYGQFRATAGHAPGQLALPDSLPGGTYRLRAYTGWMRNVSPDYFFTKELLVLNPKATATAGSSVTATNTPGAKKPANTRPDVE